ncbi:MAG: zinc ribbon domain-containing protein, partial [Deltaproteobacteria bacterium]|nr:zinc ribbon domain-containing protein [Deltaproteobacteria bacterium]
MAENFILLLGIETKTPYNKDTIEKAIKDKQIHWSKMKTSGAPIDRLNAETYLNLIPEIRATLSNPIKWDIQAAAAEKIKAEIRTAELNNLVKLLAIYNEPTIDDEGVELLIKNSGPSVTKKDVLNNLAKYSISYDPTPKRTPTARPKLDDVTATDIQTLLKFINKTSLYDFLDLGVRSSAKSLYDKADEIYKTISRKGLTDQISTVRKKLAGHAKFIFNDVSQKEKYDNARVFEALIKLNSVLDVLGRKNYLNEKAIDEFVSQARTVSVNQKIAIEYLEDYANKRNWNIQKDFKLPSSALKLCGYCDTLSKTPTDDHCHKCGKKLIIPCPNCQNPTPTENKCCSKCGFATGDAEIIDRLYIEAQELANKGDITNALTKLRSIQIYWPNWEKSSDAIQKLEAKQAAIDAKQAARADTIANIESLLQSRQLLQAHKIYQSFTKDFGPSGTESIATRLKEEISKSKEAFEKGMLNKANGDYEEAYGQFEKALDYAIDFESAQKAIAAIPPPTPKNLNATMNNSSCSINWTANPGRGDILYRIIRKANSAPNSPHDGATVAEVKGFSHTEYHVPAGIFWFYAVYATRNGIFSDKSNPAGPCVYFKPVQNVIVEASDSQIHLRWTRPMGCDSVKITRYEGVRQIISNPGVSVPTSGDRASDLKLINGVTYTYILIANYPNPTGAAISFPAAPVIIRACPLVPPPPVLDLTVRKKDNIASLNWSPPKSGQVQIRQTNNSPQAVPGQVISLSDADSFGKLINVSQPGWINVALEIQGHIFFTTLNVIDNTAVIGNSVSVVNVLDISNLKSERDGELIRLFWKWPDEIDEVLVAWGYEFFPNDPDLPGINTEIALKKNFDLKGYWELEKADNTYHYFTLFSKHRLSKCYSKGINIEVSHGLIIDIQYRIKNPYFNFNFKSETSSIILSTNYTISSLPPLLLIFKHDHPPIQINDGELLAKINNIKFENGHALVHFKTYRKHGHIKLFFEDHNDSLNF